MHRSCGILSITQAYLLAGRVQGTGSVEERRMASEAAAEASRGGHSSENVGMSSE
jgi:hypothetical protein